MVILYKTTDKPNVLNKTLNNALNVTGKFRTELNNMDLIVEIQYNNIEQIQQSNYNYVYITDLDKYYFITSFEIINNKIISLNLHIDVLMTYKTDILNSYGLLTQGNNTNMYYPTIPHTSKQVIRKIEFNKPFSENGVYVLTTIKGV